MSLVLDGCYGSLFAPIDRFGDFNVGGFHELHSFTGDFVVAVQAIQHTGKLFMDLQIVMKLSTRTIDGKW